MTAIDWIRADLKKNYSSELVDALLDSYTEIKEQYYLGKHEPSELNGGKFVEACARILQQELTKSYTPVGTSVGNMVNLLKGFEMLPGTLNESFRVHIPRVLISIYNIRNRRGVGHLGGDVQPNLADATLIATSADWILAEIYRVFYATTLDEAQRIVNELVSRKLLLVHSVGPVKRVLDPSLSKRDQALLVLYVTHPNSMSDQELFKNVEYSNLSMFRKSVLKELHRDRKIEYSTDGTCTILPPGMKYVEANYSNWVERLNQAL